MHRLIAAAVAATVLSTSPVAARITSVRIDRVEPFAGGAPFGNAGAYERVIGVARGELDPADPGNRLIVGLDQAPRNANGKVVYETDIFILRPADLSKGNHQLLFDVLNRGNKVVTNRLNRTTRRDDTNDPATAAHAGDGFLYRQSYVIAWAGWDPDAPTQNAGMAMRIPALPLVERVIRDEFVSATRGPAMQHFTLSYKAARLDQPEARLNLRMRQADPPVTLAREQWRFVDDQHVELLPAGTQPAGGAIYDLTYRARSPWVSGIGFAAQRDVVAFLKSNAPDTAGTPNPAGGRIVAAIGFGVSQSGRYLRDHIKFGFNRDEDGRRVFDGVLSHIAGIGGVFLNELFAQPGRTRTQHQDFTMPENGFPFATARTKDPLTGQQAALLRSDSSDPLLIETNTDAEYWQKGASLLGTDPIGTVDLTPPSTTRLFLIAGTQHGGRFDATDAAGPCANLRNPHDPYPAVRALLVALSDWVATGREPPASRIPRIADNTLVAAEAVAFPSLPGFVGPAAANAIHPTGDWVNPRLSETPYRPLVPAVDADGNDQGGLRLPDIAAPIGTHTGFNFYKAPFPAGELCDRDGSYLPFARARADRVAGDPRPSLQERYGSRDAFVRQVDAASAALLTDRLLLPEDAGHYRAWATSVPGLD